MSATPDILIYTTMMCPYCARAKSLFDDKGLAYKEIDVSFDPDERERLIEKSGGKRTVPQIWVNGSHVGGCDDLYALDRAGKLDVLLAGA